MPDAYSGAAAILAMNLNIISNFEFFENITRNHAFLRDEDLGNIDVGPRFDEQFAPFVVDMSNQRDTATAQRWARSFLYVNPDLTGSSLIAAGNLRGYGALYFTNLGPISENQNNVDYLTLFSRPLFGRTTNLVDRAGAGDYKKNW